MKTDALTTIGLREPREKPDGAAIRDLVTTAVRDGAAHWQRLQAAHEVLLCEHEGRDGTGTKGVDANNRLRGPFPGSSDVDVALAAEVLKEKTDMLRNAIAQGSLNAVPVDGGSDAITAGYTQIEMHYYLNGPMRRNFAAVMAQAAKWHRGYGSFIIGIGWNRRLHGRERTLRLEELYAWAVEQGTQDFIEGIAAALGDAGGDIDALEAEMQPEEAAAIEQAAQQAGQQAAENLQQGLYYKESVRELAQVLDLYSPNLCEGESLRAARAFQRGETEVDVCGYDVVENCPEIRGLRPGVDIIGPAETTDAAHGEWFVEPLWMSLRQARERSIAEGWNAKWTEELLKNPGAPFGLFAQYGSQYPWLLTTTGVGCSIPWEYRERDMVCPMLFTYRAASKAGVGAIYQCLVHDKIEGFGFHEMLDTIDGLMPYEDMRSDLTEKLLFASPGLVEDVATYQMQVKGNLDATFDAISMVVSPPLIKPSRLEGTSVRSMLSPGSEIHQNRTDTPYEFLQLQNLSGIAMGDKMDAHLRLLVARRFALRHPQLAPELAQACWQVETDDFLGSVSLLLRRVYGLIQAYGPEEVRLRVTEQPGILAATGGRSAGPAMEAVRRDEIRGSYDFSISFDTRNLVMEWVEMRGKLYAAALAIDTMGAVPRVPILRAFLGSIEPRLAGIVMGEEEASNQQIERTSADIASIISGQEPPVTPGQNHALALEYTTKVVQQSPLLQQYLQNDQVRAVMENYVKQHEMQVKQEQNKQIGRTGGRPVLSGGIKGNGR